MAREAICTAFFPRFECGIAHHTDTLRRNPGATRFAVRAEAALDGGVSNACISAINPA